MVKSCSLEARRTLYIHLFIHFCCRTYLFATMHSVTVRRTDRQRDDSMNVNSRSFCVQYDWLMASVYTVEVALLSRCIRCKVMAI